MWMDRKSVNWTFRCRSTAKIVFVGFQSEKTCWSTTNCSIKLLSLNIISVAFQDKKNQWNATSVCLWWGNSTLLISHYHLLSDKNILSTDSNKITNVKKSSISSRIIEIGSIKFNVQVGKFKMIDNILWGRDTRFYVSS